MEIIGFFTDRLWLVGMIMLGVLIWVVVDVVHRTLRSEKSMRKLNRSFKKLDEDASKIKKGIRDLPKIELGKEFKQMEDKLKQALDKLEEPPSEQK